MRKSALILILAVLVLNIALASASLSIRIDTRNPSIGEEIGFDYAFVSDSDVDILFTPTIKCLNLPEEILTVQQASLKAGVIYTGSYKGLMIEDDAITQQCLARIRVSEPFVQVKEQGFYIGGKNEMAFDLKVCKDKACSQETKVFLRNENVYLDYESSIQEPEIRAILTYPDGKTQEINLPTLIKASQIGTYELEATASKEGYQTTTKTEMFGVIEKNAEISARAVTAYDEETYGKKESGNNFLAYLIAGLTAVILVLGIAIYLAIKRKHE